ncbi:MAG: helicase C-terminal domain-containing protein [Chloroflexota bacterium]|nr:helicase C-terminal domain-containing protein [Chloroflexota bacterium]
MSSTYVAFDLETTGLDPRRDAIIEIGMVKFRDSEIVDEWSTFVNPGRTIPFFVQQLTGISDQDVAGAPPINALLGQVVGFVGESTLVAHSIGFDQSFLREAGLSFPNATLDTFELASVLLPSQTSYSLGNLTKHFGIDLAQAHRALDDARATGLLLQELDQHAAVLPLPTLVEINRLASENRWNLSDFFVRAETHARKHASLTSIEEKALKEGSLVPLLSETARQLPVFPPELEPLEQPEPLDVDLLAAFLEPDGPLARTFPAYEHRAPQVDMLRAVAEAFNHGDHLLIEAGTGTGKSMAYLLPAIAWALQNRRRVVVSTNTINLQDQLYTKDIPDLEAVFQQLLNSDEPGATGDSRFRQLAEKSRGLRVELLKGRSNYLCPRRLDSMRTRNDLSSDELRVLSRVLIWLSQTTTGDRAEIFLGSGRERAIWSRLATESGTCTAERCAGSQGGRCFFYRNRRRADGAHLLVVNHALLLADIGVGNRALPEYRHLIIDEAHHVEDATTNQLSFQATQDYLERLLSDIAPEGRQPRSGLLADIRRRIERGLPPQIKNRLLDQIAATQTKTQHARQKMRDFLLALAQFLEVDQASESPYNRQYRLDSGIRSQPGWSQVEIDWDLAGTPLYELLESVDQLRKGMVELEEAGVPDLDDLNADLSSIASQLAENYEQLNAAIIRPQENGIYWVSVDRSTRKLSIHAAPLHVGPLVETHLFHQKENVIMTSATLRTAGSYDYVQDRLHAYEAETSTVGSPFDYKASTLIFIPTDMAAPNSREFQPQVEVAVRAVAKALEGRTLALFTSYNQLRRTAGAIGPGLAANGITLYQQGSGGSRRQLLENFRNNQKSVLLGTRSFWEGVDVVGSALSGLLLVRLPFAVPSDPIVSARAETFDDPFYQYSVPDAILRFRQGFGRLIRSRQDRGVCVILDNRVLTKRYGQLFLESLPDCKIQRAPLALLPKSAADWISASESVNNPLETNAGFPHDPVDDHTWL